MNKLKAVAKSNILLKRPIEAETEVESAFEFANYVEKREASFNYDTGIFINTDDILYHSALSSQRDVLNNVLVMEATTTMCLVLASRRGNVSLVSGSCLSQTVGPSYQLPVGPGGQPTTGSSSRGCSWLCDAVVMTDAKVIVYALSDRSLHFYDTACSLRSDAVQEHRHLWKVVGLPNTITSLQYYQGAGETSMLFMGDEKGSVTTLTFLQPSTVLFHRRGLEAKPGQAESVYWPEILKMSGPHSQYVQAKIDKKVHCEAVLQMIYDHEQQIVISCSLDTKKSLILWHRTGKMPSYTFSVEEGVRCFDFNNECHQLATGSDDGIVRLWNPLVTGRPSACLTGHDAAVIDVVYSTSTQDVLISLCKFAELRIWNTRHQFCVQNVQLVQPLTQQWAAPQSLLLWNGKGDGVLVSLGPKLTEIALNNDSSSMTQSPNSNVSTDDFSSCDEPKIEDKYAIQMSSTASSLSCESPRQLQMPEMNLNLNKMPKISFKKPQYPPSALEVLKFSDDDDDSALPAGMNERIEGQARILAQRRHLVEQCAPHLALTLWPPLVLNPPSTSLPKTPSRASNLE